MNPTVGERVREWFRSFRAAQSSEQDVGPDTSLVSSRTTGGVHEVLTDDRGSVTGTGDTGTFVGQIAGDDLGYAGETGAERRAEAAQRDETDDDVTS